MISAVVLTHNSKATLEATLTSLAWCDEIVVVDDDSTDSTENIAQRFHVRFIPHKLAKDFAAQRNFGLSEARGEWVLFVDADEVVSDGLAGELKTAAASNVVDGYYLKRQDELWGRVLRHGETTSVRLIRFARKGAGRWQRPVHEVWDVHGYTRTLEHPLLHFPHPNVRQFLKDINDYSTANAQYFYDKGVRVSWVTIVAYPTAKFIQNYILRLGFLDGMPGAVIAIMMSFHSFLTRGKLWQLWHPSSVLS